MRPDQAERIRQTVELYDSMGLRMTDTQLSIGQEFVSAVIDDLAGIWPHLYDACTENEIVGPHYWP